MLSYLTDPDSGSYLTDPDGGSYLTDGTVGTVTNLSAVKVSNSQINLNSDADAFASSYLTQRRANASAWVNLLNNARSFADSENLPTATGFYSIEYRRKAVDSAGNQSIDWSNTAGVSITIEAAQLAQTVTPSQSLTAPVIVRFTDATSGVVTNPTWDFGDFVTSNQLNPAHSYLAPGTYNIKRSALVDGEFRTETLLLAVGGAPNNSNLITFDEIEIDRYYLQGIQGGPTFLTSILGNPQGNQQRDISRYNFKYQAKIAYIQSAEKQQQLYEFFITRWGQAIGFRFFPPTDNSWTDEEIAKTNSQTTNYKLIRTYSSAGRAYIRRIIKPCPDLIVKINGTDAALLSPYSINYTTGVITFANPANLPQGGSLTVTGNYCIPVYFTSDNYEATAFSSYFELSNLGIIEILPQAFGID